MKIISTGEYVGQYKVYAHGDYRWYRCNGGPDLAEWYLYTVDSDGQQIEDGAYVDFNPAGRMK